MALPAQGNWPFLEDLNVRFDQRLEREAVVHLSAALWSLNKHDNSDLIILKSLTAWRVL